MWFLAMTASYALSVSRDAPVQVGQSATLYVDGAAPGATLVVQVTNRGYVNCQPAWLCAGPLPPPRRATLRADASGRAALTFNVPAALQDQQQCVDVAYNAGGAWVRSNQLCFNVLPSGGAAMWHDGHDYWLDGFVGLQTEASFVCQQRGFTPVRIDDRAENAAVQAFAYATPRANYVWLGIDDAAVEGSFYDAWGMSPAYTAWAPGEPDNRNNQDCVVLRDDGLWSDVSCTVRHLVVCESL